MYIMTYTNNSSLVKISLVIIKRNDEEIHKIIIENT